MVATFIGIFKSFLFIEFYFILMVATFTGIFMSFLFIEFYLIMMVATIIGIFMSCLFIEAYFIMMVATIIGIFMSCLFLESYFIIMVATIIGIFKSCLFILTDKFRLSENNSGSASPHLPGCFCPWTFSLNIGTYYTYRHLNVMVRFSTRLFYRGVPALTTDFPCSVWCRGLTTCLLNVHFLEI